MVIASDGERTVALLDNVLLADGIRRLDFSTQDKDGKKRNTIRILDLDVDDADLSCGPDSFVRYLESFAAAKTTSKAGIAKQIRACSNRNEQFKVEEKLDGKIIAQSVSESVGDVCGEREV